MARLTIDAERASGTATEEQYGRLETGDILYFPTNPIELPDEDRAFLLRQKQSTAFHKNISYRPAEDRLKGVDQKDEAGSGSGATKSCGRTRGTRSNSCRRSCRGTRATGRSTSPASARSRSTGARSRCGRATT